MLDGEETDTDGEEGWRERDKGDKKKRSAVQFQS
jgi:hypothetical protein